MAFMSRQIPKPVHPIRLPNIDIQFTRQLASRTAPALPDLYTFQMCFAAVAGVLASMSFNEPTL